MPTATLEDVPEQADQRKQPDTPDVGKPAAPDAAKPGTADATKAAANVSRPSLLDHFYRQTVVSHTHNLPDLTHHCHW